MTRGAAPPRPSPVEGARFCPWCRFSGPFAFEGSGYVQDLVRCPRCDLVFSNVSVSEFAPSGIEYLDRFIEACGLPDPDDPWGLSSRFESYTLRRRLVSRYAWAVPNDEALGMLARCGPLVEIGAGGGYWAMLLRERGADVLAFDIEPHENHWVKRGWSPVERGGPEVLPALGNARALFLCWPPMSDLALTCLARFRGDTVAYVGEHQGGCCADDSFFGALERIYEQVEECHLPQWPGIHDYLSVWKKP